MTGPGDAAGAAAASGEAPAVAVILAAGAGRRLGGVAKALLEGADGKTFLEAVVACATAAGVRDQVVVVGPPHGAAIEPEARRLGAAVVVNPTPERGMASSVAAGFAHARTHFPGAGAALLWPVDHAHVRSDTVARIARACGPEGVVIPVHGGRGGHPTAFGRAAWAALALCASAPRGARSVIQAITDADPRRIARIEVDDEGVIADVDTPWDRR